MKIKKRIAAIDTDFSARSKKNLHCFYSHGGYHIS
jgi:hypothetical protein